MAKCYTKTRVYTNKARQGGNKVSMLMDIKEVDVDIPQKRQRFTIGVVGGGSTLLQHICVFAEAGFEVVAIDVDHHLINLVKKNTVPSADSMLNKPVKKYLEDGRLTIIRDIREAASQSDVIVILVQPLTSQKKKPDYSKIERICKKLGIGLRSGCLVIVASSLGSDVIESLIKETLENASGLKAGVNFGMAYSPLYTRSKILTDDSTTCKMVVGAINKQSQDIACLILGTITKELLIVSDMKTAEAVRLFRDTYENLNIALANELARYCEKAGIDFIEVQSTVNKQRHCYLPTPKITPQEKMNSLYLLLEEAEAVDAKLPLLILARKSNDGILHHTLRLVGNALQACDKPMRRSRISILGVSCRPNEKEFRGSLIKKLVRMMNKKGMHVRVYDPLFSCEELTGMGYPAEKTIEKTVEGADCLVVTIGHDQFKKLKLRKIKFIAKGKVAIVDMAHIISPVEAEREGFVYRGIGRGIWTK
ncbi:MAG: nucleotide sugar dehydrogenase [Candidatus Bathyarchaeota archaeon]|nr:nucleotide sugar dehydrogenase [Candidatus Bathyarchaeota archaeon]